MKLTRIMSLVLALVLAVSVFSSVVVSAADTAELKFVVKDGDNVVSGELEKDKVYTLEIVLDNISTGKVAGVEFKLAYNKDVLKFVDASGADVSGSAAFITTVSGGLVPFGTPVAADGVIAYTVAPDVAGNASLAIEIKNNGLEVGNTFVVTKMNFKTIADGKLGLALHEDNKLNVAVPAKAEVTVIPSSERVGKIAYVSATADADFAAAKTYVVGKTDAEAVLADLAKDYASVKVTYVDEEGAELPKEAAITWAADKAFDAEKAGEYKFVGTVATPDGINYTGAAVTVEATITLDTLKVQEVKAIDDIIVRVTDEPNLPTVVSVVITGGEVVELPVAWEVVSLDPATGVSVLEGTITGTDNIDVDGKKATLKVIALIESQNKAPEALNPVAVNAAIDADDIAADALAALPEFVVVTADNSYINVTWEQVSEAPEAGYALGDVITFKPVATDVTFPADFVAEVTVAVPAGKEEVVFEATEFETEDIKTDAGYTLEKAVEDAAFAGEYADGTAADLSTIVWDFEGADFDAETAGVYELTGTWADVYGNEATFTITINIVNAGATGIAIYSSENASKPITSIVMNVGESMKLYHRFTPADAIDSVTWTTSKDSVVRFSVDAIGAPYVTLKARSAGTCEITATTTTGVSATIKVVVSASTDDSYTGGGSAYNKNPAVGQLLSNAADAMEQQKVAESSAFADLGGYEWAATQIETLRLLSIVSGKTNTTFAPADSVTRAEFLAMIVRLFGLKANGEAKAFIDVPADAWYYDTVAIASSLGIAYGYENGAFDPNAVISRQDMAVFAERAVSIIGLTPVRGIERAFNDATAISEYAKVPVSNMSAYGVINGMNDGNFCPQDTANRAQAAVVVYNLYMLKNK